MIAPVFALLREEGLRGRSIRGAAFTFLQFGGQNVLRLLSNLVLTRLLFPEAFGLMALVMVVMTGLQMFSDLGFRLSIVQDKRGDDPVFLNTAWTMQIGRGVLLWGLAAALALPAASFYDVPMLGSILPVMGLTAVIAGFNSTRMATVNRHMMLGRLTVVTLGCQVITLIVTVVLAYAFASVWALVVGQLFGSLLLMVLSHTALPGLPNRLQFERSAFRQLFGFGKFIFLATVAGFLVNQGDRAILGKFVSLSDLALYNIAYMFASVPMMLAGKMADRVLFPLYANRPPSESAANRKKIAKARMLTTGTLLVATAVLAVSGDVLVRALYDPRYFAAGPVLVLLSVSFLPGLIISSYSGLFLAAGHSGRFAIYVSASAIVRMGLLLVVAPRFGVAGVALVPLLSDLMIYPLLLGMLRPYRGWDLRHDTAYFVLAAGIAGLAFWLNRTAIGELLSVAGLAG